MTKSEGQRLSHVPRMGGSVHSFLDKDEYTRLCTEQGKIRKEIADVNRQITPARGVLRVELEQKKRVLLSRWEELNTILQASERAKQAITVERLSRLGATGIVDVLLSAKSIIEQLQEKIGDDWTQEQKDVCGALRKLTISTSPLLDMVSRSDADAKIAVERDRHTTEIAHEKSASQQAVGILKSQLRDIQENRGRAAAILERLYNERYEEVDGFRKARGVTHRIHLTDDDCRAIEDAIRG